MANFSALSSALLWLESTYKPFLKSLTTTYSAIESFLITTLRHRLAILSYLSVPLRLLLITDH